MRKHRGYLAHDELRIPTPYGSQVEILRRDDSVEKYSFLGVDANGRQVLRHVDGRNVLFAFTVPFSSVRVIVPAAPAATAHSDRPRPA